jgi:hypothetical protein
MQNTGKRCVILLVFIILRWSFNYESNVFRYNKILIDCVFGNSKFVVPSTLTIDLGFASVNSQCLRDNKLAIPSYPVNKYIISWRSVLLVDETGVPWENHLPVVGHRHTLFRYYRHLNKKIMMLEIDIRWNLHKLNV